MSGSVRTDSRRSIDQVNHLITRDLPRHRETLVTLHGLQSLTKLLSPLADSETLQRASL